VDRERENIKMIEETTRIPYTTSPVPEGPWLVFSVHPKDAMFGMGGSLLLAEQQGTEVTMVILTNVSVGDSAPETESARQTREQEEREVARLLHVGDVQFWGQSGRLLRPISVPVSRVAELIQQVEPRSIFFPSPMELHADHRIVSELVWEGLRRCPGSRAIAHAYEVNVQCPANRLVDITSVAEAKASLVALYSSQVAEKDVVSAVMSLNKTRAYTLPAQVDCAEAFYAYASVAERTLTLHTIESLSPYWKWEIRSQTPLVSVIIRTKDRPHMLDNALKSLAQQIYPVIEALIINDDGVDVEEVVCGYEGLIPRLQYIHLSPNKGRSAAANIGLKEAAGKYLMFLDDDDWLHPDHIARLVDVLERDETNRVAYAGVECMSEQEPGQWSRVHTFDEPFDPILLMIRNFIPMHAALFDRELVECGCRFDENLSIYEDWDFWVQLSLKTGFRHVGGISAVYRIGSTGGFGVSGDESLQYQSERFFFEKWRHLWSHQQLHKIIEYARHEVDFRFLKKEIAISESRLQSAVAELNDMRGKLEEKEQLWQKEKEQLWQREKENLRVAKSLAEEWANRCAAMEKSWAWRLTRPLATVLALVKRGCRYPIAGVRRYMHYFSRGREFYRREGIKQLMKKTCGKMLFPGSRSADRGPDSWRAFSNHRPIVPPDIIKADERDVEGLIGLSTFDYHEHPLVSVIIPVFNRIRYTAYCLASISKNMPENSFEIIVVDDGSTDETERLIGSIPNLRYMRNEANLGFLRSCNRGASQAKGRYIMFLNNDTQVLPGWLDELVKTFLTLSDVGICGSKLIYPSGHLQEAGSILKRNGTVDLVGLNDDPRNPYYNFVRDVDHCSAASVLMERELFERLGGFDEAYAPAYFEDADLSMRVRGIGKRIVYQPSSVVVHHLSVTTNQADGDKMRQIERNRMTYLKRWASELRDLDMVRLIAFYLPQYHPIRENDKWWGKGFTEWTNVTRARPLFYGHYQPRLPSELGFYDLRVPEVREAQADLAREHGIYGFCYYYYWFSGKRLLYRPLDEMLQTGRPDFPFCVCWANENWSRRWDGLDSEILIAQSYSEEDDREFIKALARMFDDKRYIRVNGKPLVLIYRVGLLPDPVRTTQIWREYCQCEGIGEIYLSSVQSFGDMRDPESLGFDAAVEFPPQAMAVRVESPHGMICQNFEGMFFDYVQTAENYCNRSLPDHRLFRTVMVSWDNSARREEMGHIFLNAEPEHYGRWLRQAIDETRKFKFGDERLVFINAWNEWSEGNYLEPDLRNGRKYLEETVNAVKDLAVSDNDTVQRTISYDDTP